MAIIETTIKHEMDPSPDYSFLGQWTNYQEPHNKDQKLVHRASGLVMDHHRIWRDGKGHIQPTPEEPRYSREYQYTYHDNGHDKLAYAIQDNARMEKLERGDWYFIGIIATAYVDHVAIGHASLWGIESDSGDHYIHEVEEEMRTEAMKDAETWLERNRWNMA